MLLLFLLFWALPVQAVSAVENEAVRERMVREPVFGGQVLIQEAGRKGNPPLVLIHGLGDLASGTWQGLLPQLARDYHVVTFDLPGFGRSQKQNSLYSPGNYATFVKWVVDTFIGASPIIAGHSLGGAIALRYAGTYPEALTRLVLVDTAGVLDRRVYTKEMLRVLAGDVSDPVTVEGFLGNLVSRIPEPFFDLDLMLDNAPLRSRMLGGDPAIIAALALVQENFSPYLFRVRVPTVILWGEHDQVTPLRTGTVLEANLPLARLQVIPGAGHVPMLEVPQLFERAFFEALSGPILPQGFPAGGEERIGRCAGQDGVEFSGAYAAIDIADCRNVRLQNVTAQAVRVVRSQVVFDRGAVGGAAVGLTVENSVVTANGLRVAGPVALRVANSRLDLAGVQLVGSDAAINAVTRSTLIFSVSRIQSPHGCGTIHGMREMAAGEAL